MLVDLNIQLDSGWSSHIPSDGSDIGGVDPAAAFMQLGLPNQSSAAYFFIQGIKNSAAGGYPSAEHYVVRPWLPNSGSLQLDFDLWVDPFTQLAAQALEFDSILSDPQGWKYNGSMQINYAEGGVVQVANATGGWVDTVIKPGILLPSIKHHVTINYLFNTSAHTISVHDVIVDGEINTAYVPNTIPAVLAKWAPGVIFQVQRDLTAKAALAGSAFGIALDNVQYTWK